MFATLKAITAIFSNSKFNTARLNRGYEFMLNSNSLYTIRKLIRSICEYEYNKASQESQKQIFENLTVSDLAFFNAQCDTSYLLSSFAFNRAVANYYASESNFIFPLNKEWQNIFTEHGIKINRPACTFFWKSYKVMIIIRSSIAYFEIFYNSVSKKLEQSKKVYKKNTNFLNVYFYDISKRNLPSLTNDIYEKNIITWYKKNVLKDNKINVHHNVKNFNNKGNLDLGYEFTYSKSLFFQTSIFEEFKNLRWLIQLFLKNIIKSDIKLSLLANFNEILKAKSINEISDDLELNAVVFNNSIGSIKPIWAVVLERSGVRIDYCFYSSNSEPLDIDGNLPIDGIWALAIWNNYYLCDEYQKLELEKRLLYKYSKIYFDSIPWWTDVNLTLPLCTKKSICLFDTILNEELFTFGVLNQFGWAKSEVASLYLKTVLEVANDLGFEVLYKIKRFKNSKQRNEKYWNTILELMTVYNNIIIQIDDRISAERLILNSSVVISKPLSTTALIAKYLNKPTVYLDPTKMINIADPALRDIMIVSTKQELSNFIATVIK